MQLTELKGGTPVERIGSAVKVILDACCGSDPVSVYAGDLILWKVGVLSVSPVAPKGATPEQVNDERVRLVLGIRAALREIQRGSSDGNLDALQLVQKQVNSTLLIPLESLMRPELPCKRETIGV